MERMEDMKYLRRAGKIMVAALLVVCQMGFLGSALEEVAVSAEDRVVAADESLFGDGIYYVALGDSIAAGYGLEGYQAGEVHSAVDSYRELLVQGLGERYPGVEIYADSLAVDGMDSGELLDCLTGTDEDDVAFQERVAGAELVTLSIGSNDILGLLIEEMAETLSCGQEEIADAISGMIENGDILAWLSLLGKVEELNRDLAGVASDVDGKELEAAIVSGDIPGNEKFNQACEQFGENFEKIIEAVHSLAPEAKVYVTNIYNPYRGVALENPLTDVCAFDLGNLAEFYIGKLNQVFTEESDLYELADVKAVFDSCEKIPVNANITEVFGGDVTLEDCNVDPHPTKMGHALIAEAIQGKMDKEEIPKEKLLPEKGTEFTAGNFECVVTSSGRKMGEVKIMGIKKSVKRVVIPDKITVGSKQLFVTSVGKGAWKKDKKIKSLTLGANVEVIGKKAFYCCKNLKEVKVLSEKITKVGTGAFKKISKKAAFEFPEKWEKEYKKYF